MKKTTSIRSQLLTTYCHIVDFFLIQQKNVLDKEAANGNWDEVIRPRRGWLDVRLNELWKYRDLLMLFVRRDFVSVYKQTILGPLWYLLQAFLTTIAFTIIFGKVAKPPASSPRPAAICA